MFHAQALKLDSVGVESPPAQRGEIQMRSLALCVMLFASAAYGQECIRGKILLSTTVCPCTEKVTTIANCWPDGENQYGCESGGHKIICGGNPSCDVEDASECNPGGDAVRRKATRALNLGDPDVVQFMRPKRASAACSTEAFDRWFDEKLKSRNEWPKAEAGGA